MGRAARSGAVIDTPPFPSRKDDFFIAFRESMGSVGCAHNQIARSAGVGQSSISCYNTGRRVPRQASLERIYKALESEARRLNKTLPHSLANLHSLREAAMIESIAPVTAAAWTSDTDSAVVQRKPASAASSRRRVRRAMLAQRKVSYSSAPVRGPVPHQVGDRPSAEGPYAADIATYRRHMEAGRVRDAHFIAWAMGSNLPSLEFPRAVASYRKADAEEGAETMLSTAAKRDIQTSVNIAAALLDEGQLADAQVLLTALRTDT